MNFNIFSYPQTDCLPPRMSFCGLPNEMIRHIADRLPLHEHISSQLSEVSYQFYTVLKPIRVQLNKDLMGIYEKISRIVMDSFYQTWTILPCHFDFTVEQRFFINVDYQFDEKTCLTTLHASVEKQDDELNFHSLKPGPTNFLLIDKIRRKKSCLYSAAHSSKVQLIADSNLKMELRIVALRVLEKINKNRK